MCFEHVGEAEALAAHLAGIRLLPRVRAAVALHVGPAGEALPADLTNERLLSCRFRAARLKEEQKRHTKVCSASVLQAVIFKTID